MARKQTDHSAPQTATAGPALPDFEASMDELEQIVERLEAGELSLEQSLGDFERGVHLTRACQQALQQAELRVQQLVEADAAQPGPNDFPPATDSDAPARTLPDAPRDGA